MEADIDWETVAVIGSLESGKSTTIGHLAFKLGRVQEEKLAPIRVELAQMGKAGEEYAWVMDSNSRLRARLSGSSKLNQRIDLSFGGRNCSFKVCPGHKRFYRHNQNALFESNHALLIHDPIQAKRESPDSLDWADLLADCVGFGVHHLLVAINKMDLLQWSQELYLAEVQRVKLHLDRLGVLGGAVSFCPVSGLRGENLAEKTTLMPWYQGPSLAQLFTKFQKQQIPPVLSLRLVVRDSFKVGGVGTCVIGRVASGEIRPQMECTILTPKKKY